MKNNIKICYSEQVKTMLLSALGSDIKNMEDLKDKQRSGIDIDVNKLPGTFHYYNDIDDMIKSYNVVRCPPRLRGGCPKNPRNIWK